MEIKSANRWGFIIGIIGILIAFADQAYDKFVAKPATPIPVEHEVQTPPEVPRPIIEAPSDITLLLEQIAANTRTLVVEQIGINSNYVPTSSEKKIKEYQVTELFKSEDHSVSVNVSRPQETQVDGRGLIPIVRMEISIDGQRLSQRAMEQFFKLDSPTKSASFNNGNAVLGEGDSVIISDNCSFKVARILRMETNILTRGDKENGAILELSGQVGNLPTRLEGASELDQ